VAAMTYFVYNPYAAIAMSALFQDQRGFLFWNRFELRQAGSPDNPVEICTSLPSVGPLRKTNPGYHLDAFNSD
jgi:hypothetical protein